VQVRLRGDHRGPAGWEIVTNGHSQPATTERLLSQVHQLRQNGRVDEARALFAQLSWLALIGAAWRDKSLGG
jgi:hypothetical protein